MSNQISIEQEIDQIDNSGCSQISSYMHEYIRNLPRLPSPCQTKSDSSLTTTPYLCGSSRKPHPNSISIEATAYIGFKINTKQLSLAFPSISNFHEKYEITNVEISRNPYVFVNVTSEGYLAVSAARDEEYTLNALQTVLTIIHRAGYVEAKLLDFKVQSAQVSIFIPYYIPLKWLIERFAEDWNCKYHNPSILYRVMKTPFTTLAITMNRYALITSPNVDYIYEAVNELEAVLEEYRSS